MAVGGKLRYSINNLAHIVVYDLVEIVDYVLPPPKGEGYVFTPVCLLVSLVWRVCLSVC